MSTYRELIYLIIDEIKGVSDDFTYTESHVKFILDKYRMFILKQRYNNGKHVIPQSNYQTICLPIEVIEDGCSDYYELKSVDAIPTISSLGSVTIHSGDSISAKPINSVPMERYRYAGSSKFSTNTYYATRGTDNHLYLKSKSPFIKYLKSVKVSALFEDSTKATELACNKVNEEEGTSKCDLDMPYPIEEALIPPIMELTIKELLGASYRFKDFQNNGNDDIEDIMSVSNLVRSSAKNEDDRSTRSI